MKDYSGYHLNVCKQFLLSFFCSTLYREIRFSFWIDNTNTNNSIENKTPNVVIIGFRNVVTISSEVKT